MAGDSTGAVQAALRSALLADAAVTAIVGTRIYDVAKEVDTFPYITFGASNGSPWDGQGFDGEEVFIMIDGWSEKAGHKTEAQDLQKAIRDALHDATLAVAGHTAIWCRVQDARIVPSGQKDRMAHTAVRVQVVTQ